MKRIPADSSNFSPKRGVDWLAPGYINVTGSIKALDTWYVVPLWIGVLGKRMVLEACVFSPSLVSEVKKTQIIPLFDSVI